jgi:hypothetical protein
MPDAVDMRGAVAYNDLGSWPFRHTLVLRRRIWMNVFNRIVMVLCLLLMLAAAVALIAFPLDSVAAVRACIDRFEQAMFNDQFFYIFLGAAAALGLVALLLVILEFGKPRKKSVRIKTKGGGNAVLGIDSVAQSLEYRIDELAGVRKVQSRIVSRGRDVEVTIDLDTSPSVNVPVLTDQIIDMCHDIVEQQLGVRIRGKVGVNVRHEPYPRGTVAPTGPLGDAAIAKAPALTDRRGATTQAAEPVAAPQPIPPLGEPIVPEVKPEAPTV